MYPYVNTMYSYVSRMYSYVTRIYWYVTRMYSYVTRMYTYVLSCVLVCTRMLIPFEVHRSVLIFHTEFEEEIVLFHN